MSDPHIERMLVLSTAHVDEDTANWLNSDDGTYPTPIMTREEGWLLWVPTDGDERALLDAYDKPLTDVFMKAREENCEWVLLDRDAARLEDLPTWEW